MRNIFLVFCVFFLSALVSAQLPLPPASPNNPQLVGLSNCNPAQYFAWPGPCGVPGGCARVDQTFIYIPTTIPVSWGPVTAFGPISACIGPKIGVTVHIGTKFLEDDGISYSPTLIPVGSLPPIFIVGPHNQLSASLGPTIAEQTANILLVDLAAAVLVPSAWQQTISIPPSLPWDALGVLFPIPVDPAVIGTRWDAQSARLDVPTNLLWLSSTDTFEVGS